MWRDRPLEGFGFSEVAAALQDSTEVVEIDGDLDVLGTEGGLEHCRGLAEVDLGLVVAAEPVDDGGVRSLVGGDGDMVGAEGLFTDLDRSLGVRLCGQVVAAGVLEAPEIVIDAG